MQSTTNINKKLNVNSNQNYINNEITSLRDRVQKKVAEKKITEGATRADHRLELNAKKKTKGTNNDGDDVAFENGAQAQQRPDYAVSPNAATLTESSQSLMSIRNTQSILSHIEKKLQGELYDFSQSFPDARTAFSALADLVGNDLSMQDLQNILAHLGLAENTNNKKTDNLQENADKQILLDLLKNYRESQSARPENSLDVKMQPATTDKNQDLTLTALKQKFNEHKIELKSDSSQENSDTFVPTSLISTQSNSQTSSQLNAQQMQHAPVTNSQLQSILHMANQQATQVVANSKPSKDGMEFKFKWGVGGKKSAISVTTNSINSDGLPEIKLSSATDFETEERVRKQLNLESDFKKELPPINLVRSFADSSEKTLNNELANKFIDKNGKTS